MIQPSGPINIKRQCKNPDELEQIYRMGVKDASERLVEINRFIAMYE